MSAYTHQTTVSSGALLIDENTKRAQAESVLGRHNSAICSPEPNNASAFDQLTGLLNSQTFLHTLDEYLACSSSETPYNRGALISFDLENFKLYNASQGYRRGDALLRMFARIVEANFPEGLIARIADDRFAVFSHEDKLEERIGHIHARVLHATADIKVKTKAGIYLISQNDTALEAHDKATLARMSVKKDHRRPFAFFDSEHWASLNRAHYILSRIDDAIAHGCIRVYYQPIVDVETGNTCAFEALARWDDPVLGFLPPGEFIETLEQANLVHKLDLEIVRQVCRDLAGELALSWPGVAVSVNLSRADFEACDIAGEVERLVEASGIDRKLLHLEITESALVDSECALNEGILQLQDEGYSLFMDDFGSGYSTLNVLKDYDFDTLKIDLRFLDCSESRRMDKARSIIASVVRMAQSIGMRALAEGVETEEQLAFLTKIGCEMVQGYLFGRPQPIEQMNCCAA